MANKCKYYKLVRQVSYNSGQTWSNVDPPQYQQGDLYELHSADCPSGDTPTPTGTTIYRWVDSGETCSGTSLYVQQIKQVSYDGGTTWQNVVPIQTNYGSLISDCSPECGGIPKFVFYYNTGKVWSECCPEYYPSDYTAIWYYTVHEDLSAGPYKAMTAATIGECVDSLYGGSFNGCEALENVTMTDSVVLIDEVAFQYCSSLTSITLSDNITEIRGGAFRGCYNLPNITLPSKLTYISNECFIACRSLTSISIPPLVSYIVGSFKGCENLSSVTFQSNEVLNNIFPDTFSGCKSLTSITIPDSVQIIGSDAFADCENLGEIVIGCNVESIGRSCFTGIGGSNNLSSVDIYFKSTTPPTYDTTNSDKRLIHAFPRYVDGPVLNVYVPNEALAAYSYHFPTSGYDCNLYGYNPSPCDYYYNPPSGVDYKYYGVLNIGNTIPDEDGIPRPYKLIEADETTTLSCDETIFNGVTHVKKVFVGEGITSACIATSNHFELEEVEFPSTVESIGGDFSRTSITKVTIKALTPPIVGRNTFGSNSEYPIYVPNSALADYKSSIYWTYQTNYADRLVGY